MGAGVSTTRNEGRAKSDAIDRHIQQELRNRTRVNVLLLGSDPKRSAIVKQLKVQHGLTEDERMSYCLTIRQNCITGAQTLAQAIRNAGTEFADHTVNDKADRILGFCTQYNPSLGFSPEFVEAIYEVWQDPVVLKVLDLRDEPCLSEENSYFLEEISRIGSTGYIPTDDDILWAREDRSQIIETCFPFGRFQMTIINYDSRHSARKWIHYFEGITYILFCTSLSDYDRVWGTRDDENELLSSIVLFESIVNSHRFTLTSVTLLLTDVDAFEAKLSKIPLDRYFPDYPGGAHVDQALAYIRSQFTRVNRAHVPTFFILDRTADPITPQCLSGILNKTVVEDTSKDVRMSPPCSRAMKIRRLCSICPRIHHVCDDK